MTNSRSGALDEALLQVNRLLKHGRSQAAVEKCRHLLADHPDHVEVLYYLGMGLLRQEQLAEADHYFARAMRAAPASPGLLNEIGILRLRQKLFDEAIGSFSGALDLDPLHSDALNNIATTFNVLQRPRLARSYLKRLTDVLPFSAQAHAKAADNCLILNDVEEAVTCGRRSVTLAPAEPQARLSLADSLEASGRFRQAKFQYLATLAHVPAHATALSKLLALKGTRIDEQHRIRAEELAKDPALTDPDRVQLHMALARFCDQERDYDAAFEHLAAANGIRLRGRAFDGSLYERAVDRHISVFSKEFFQSLVPREASSRRPIFIVGMPRSGTTLVEQILASHSRIDAGGELPLIINLAMQMGGSHGGYPEGVRGLDGATITRMAGEYVDNLPAASAGAIATTDKMPFNFMHLGFIRTLFPDAVIIHCRRSAPDTCLSCLFTTFSDNLELPGEPEGLGRYYLEYRRLMAHWRTVSPVPFLDLDYEALVDDPQHAVRSLLGFCGVEFEPECVSFYQTERGVRTPSRWQVRQPIYRHSVGRWRHYERHLQPLLRILQPVLLEESRRTGMLS